MTSELLWLDTPVLRAWAVSVLSATDVGDLMNSCLFTDTLREHLIMMLPLRRRITNSYIIHINL